MPPTESALVQKPPGRSPLLVVFLTVFIDLLGFGIVIPLLPIYSKLHQASELELGLLFGCFSGMQFLFAPMWGRVSDRIGRRPVLIGGLLGTAGSYALFAFASSMPLLFASRLLAGFFGANISTAQAYIADVTTPENRAKGMGLIGAAFGLGFTLGPWLGGELSAIDMRAPGFLACGLSLFAALFGYVKLVEPLRHSAAGSRVFGFEELRTALSESRLRGLLVQGFVAVFAFSAFETMFTRFGLANFPANFGVPVAIEAATAEQVLAAAPVAGRYMGVIGILAALIQGGLIRRLVPKYGELRLAIAGPLALALGLFCVGLAPNFAWVIVGCVLLPLGTGLNTPSVYGLLSRAAPADHQGAYMGLNQSTASLARLSGPLVAGLLFHVFGPAAPFLAAGVLLLLATWLAWNYREKHGASFGVGAGARAV